MPAYVVVQIVVNDPVAYEEYRLAAPPTIAQYDGKYLVRGGRVETLEGDWMPQRFVILEFPTFERAQQWHASPEYQAIAPLRHRYASSQMLVVEGLS